MEVKKFRPDFAQVDQNLTQGNRVPLFAAAK
jgi:hypothetical protein